MKKNLLITGQPRVGKTTLIKWCLNYLEDNADGFYTEEIPGEGMRGRSGFYLTPIFTSL